MSARLTPRFALLLLLSAPACAGTITVAMPRVANTYFLGEPLHMTVCAQGAQRTLQYSVYDYWNALSRAGTMRAGGGQSLMLTLRPGLQYGHYRLALTDGTDKCEDTFCVIPRPYDDPGDYTLFGLHPNDGASDENLSAAQQVGVRVVRQNIPWPTIEPNRDQWDMSWLDGWTGLARKYGMQMMFVLGFTPRWEGEEPENYLDDWAKAAWFTWHPKEPNEWGKYLEKVTGYLHGQTVQWPGPQVMPSTNPPATMRLPLAQSWELWNEADICFYMGDWGRYNDLLHMAWATGRRALPDVPMIYGGSTGNFIAMGVTASGSARYCFDYIALHTGGDLEDALRVWYSGSQQIPWVVGAPRETIHTECYAQGRRGAVDLPQYHETPDEMLRTYLTLKAWREVGFYRSGCLGGWILSDGMMAPGTAMLVPNQGHLSPTPLYPTFACTRQLLSDASEVGPVNLGDKITAHVFLKHGRVMLAAWSDDGAQASLALASGAYQLDALGGKHYLPPVASLAATLTAAPTVIVRADPRAYLGQALLNRYHLLMDTPYGTPQVSSVCTVWYAAPLSKDLGVLVGTKTPSRLETTVRQAATALAQQRNLGPASVLLTQDACWQTMQQVIAVCPAGQELPVGAADSLWRLAKMDEWLGAVADDRAGLFATLQVTDAELTSLTARLQSARGRLASVGGDADLPCSKQILDRAIRLLPRLRQVRRQGTYLAISHQIDLVKQLRTLEKPVVLRVVPILDFTTSRCFRKARVLEPGRMHTLTVWAYNTLDHPVSGTLTLKLPPTWSPNEQTIPFTAWARQPSAPTAVQVTLPQDPTPWKSLWSFTMDGMIDVSLPESLTDRPTVEIDGQLSTGEELSPMVHYVNVGHWLDDPSANAAPDHGAGGPSILKQKGGSPLAGEPLVQR